MSDRHRRLQFGVFLGTLGVAFAASGLLLWFVLYRTRTTAINQLILGVIVHVLFGYIVLMAGLTVYRSDLSGSECMLATKQSLVGAGLMGVLVVWRALPELRSGVVTLEFLNQLVVVSSVGAAAGVLVGLNRSQAMRNRRLAVEKDGREETLVFLLQLLDHDIQNHLTAISSYTSTIDPSAVDSRTDPIAAIQDRTKDIERLLEAANAVLESETGNQEFERINIASVLREQLSVFRSETPRVDIKTDIDDELYVESNRFIGDVFHNILDNAVTHNETNDLTVVVLAKKADDGVVVDIADDGSGIADPIRSEIFDPGIRADGSDGDGIGLYLVRKLVESYGGHVAVENRSPSGTRFRVWLPKG